MRGGGSKDSFAYQNISTDPFVKILVPLERGGSRRHFELLYIKIHRRSSEISLPEDEDVEIFLSIYIGFPYILYPPPHEEISITMILIFLN